MTYTSRLFDAHKTVVESFIIEQDGLDAYKNIKYAPKLSEAKIKYAMLERMLEIVAGGIDTEAVANTLQADKERTVAAFKESVTQNHVAPEVIEEREAEFYEQAQQLEDNDSLAADMQELACLWLIHTHPIHISIHDNDY